MMLFVGVFHSRLNVSNSVQSMLYNLLEMVYDFVVVVVVVIVVATVPYSLLFGDLYSRFYLLLLASDHHLFKSI